MSSSAARLNTSTKEIAGLVERVSKQRNKHIQQVLVEAARLAPRYGDELTLLYERERQLGNCNRATLAVARKMVAWMLAVDKRNKDFVPAGNFKRTAAA
jgi:transposase